MSATASNYIYYTTTQLNCIKAAIQRAIGECVGDNANANLYMTAPCNAMETATVLTMCYDCIDSWQQWPDGTTTGLDNFITQSQFVDVVEYAKELSNCNCS